MSTNNISLDGKISLRKIEMKADIEEDKTKQKQKRNKINNAEKIKEIEENLGEMFGLKPGKIKVKVTKIKNESGRKAVK